MFFLTLDLGYSMSMDVSKGMRFDDAGLYIKFKGDTCLTFWYNMRGNGAGSIEVIVDMDHQPVLELKGPKDTNWHKAQVEITGAKRKVRLSVTLTTIEYCDSVNHEVTCNLSFFFRFRAVFN